MLRSSMLTLLHCLWTQDRLLFVVCLLNVGSHSQHLDWILRADLRPLWLWSPYHFQTKNTLQLLFNCSFTSSIK